MSYITDLEKKYLYLKKNNYSEKKIAWLLLVKQICFLLSGKDIQSPGEEKKLRIAFRTNGGFGNVLIHANFIKKLSEYIGKNRLEIIVYAHPIPEISDAIFKGQEFVDSYYNYTDLKESDFHYFDLVVDIHSFPEILKANMSKIHAISPVFYHLLEDWDAFRRDDNYERFFTLRPYLNSQIYLFSILNKKNCLNVADITNAFNIEDFDIDIKIFKPENSVLSNYKLKKRGYITLQRGVNPFSGTTEAPKMWPKEYYEELVILLKQRYPEIKIIQLGESKERCESISGVDLNLVGETDWDDLKVLLKNALYHIDGECGMVHLRKALKAGPSVVLFGPTPIEFFGYNDNINISTSACNHWCAALTTSWQKKCLLGKAKCMYSITPLLVIEKIKDYESHKMVKKSSLLDKLSNDKKLFLDPEWKSNFLKGAEIFAYEIVKIPLSDLKIRNFVDGKWKILPIKMSPALDYLGGNKQKYISYINYKNSHVGGDLHSIDRFERLIKSFSYDSKVSIIVNPDNIIMDGQHRASLLYKRNKEMSVEVLKIYGNFD